MCTDTAPHPDPFDQAARYLSTQPRCMAEMRRYLQKKGYEAAVIEEVMERLCDYGYVDDAAYCRTYFRQAARRGKGRRRIERELQQKGVAPAVITDALDAMIDEASASSGADGEGTGEDGYAEDSWASDGDARLYDEAARALDVAEKMRRQQLAAEKKVDEAFLARVGRRLYALGYAQGLIYHVLHTLRDRA